MNNIKAKEILENYFGKQQLTAVSKMYAETETALLGEAGEIIDAIKKIEFHTFKDREVLKRDLTEELGDYIWYLTQFFLEKGAIQYYFDTFSILLSNFLNLGEEALKYYKERKYRDFTRKLYYSTYFLTDSTAINFDKKGFPYPGMVGLTPQESECFQDVVHVILGLCAKYDISFLEMLNLNIQKLEKRYKERIDLKE